MLDELISSSDVVWVGSKASGSNAKEAGEIAFYPAGSLLLNQPESAVDKLNDNETLTMPDAVLTALSGGGAFPIQLLSAVTKTIWLEHAEAQVNPETGRNHLSGMGRAAVRRSLMVTGMAGENDEQFVRTSTSASARRQNRSRTPSCRA